VRTVARPSPRTVRAQLVRTGLPAFAIAVALAGCGTAQHNRRAAATLHLHATRTSLTRIDDNGPNLGAGDSFIASSNIAGGGHQDAYCVVSERAHTDLCTVTVLLPRGQLSAQGVFEDAPRLTGTIAVLSGTGAYESAEGTLTTGGLADTTESLTLRLTLDG
jgi:hypothetical protein